MNKPSSTPAPSPAQRPSASNLYHWHRILGGFLTDLFSQLPYDVIIDQDLALQAQRLDIIILRHSLANSSLECPLPDGLDNLSTYNLITYKSLHESLDHWAILELTGHFVNYCKTTNEKIPKSTHQANDLFRLYGICTRFPRELSKHWDWQRLQPGVYQIAAGSYTIRIIVLGEIPPGRQNAIWHLLSGQSHLAIQGLHYYNDRGAEMGHLLTSLLTRYQLEGVAMPYTMDEYKRDFVRDNLNVLTAEDVLKHYSPDEVIKHYSSDEVIKHYSPDEVIKHYSPDEIANNLSPEKRKILLDTLQKLTNKP